MLDAFFRFCHRFERRVSAPVLASLAAVLFFSAVVGYSVGRDDHTPSKTAMSTPVASPSLTSAVPATAVGRTPFPNFRTVEFLVADQQGAQPKSHCGLLADTDALRGEGLMHKKDLGGYDGMVFVFQSDVSASFYMANVTFPISVAWLDSGGHFLSAADMEPCAVAADACPRYGAISPYRFAIETAKGGLDSMHIGPGSQVSVGSGNSCV